MLTQLGLKRLAHHSPCTLHKRERKKNMKNTLLLQDIATEKRNVNEPHSAHLMMHYAEWDVMYRFREMQLWLLLEVPVPVPDKAYNLRSRTTPAV